MKETSRRVAVFANGIPSSTSESFLLRELEFVEVYDDVSLFLVPFTVSPGWRARGTSPLRQKAPVPLLDSIIPRRPSARIPSLRGFWKSVLLFRDDLLRADATWLRRKSAVLKYLVSIYRSAKAYDWVRVNVGLLESFDTLYFYWGDKGALVIPHIREMFGKLHRIVVRLHGFDLYQERTGGYLPLRDAIFSGADIVAPISQHGARYLVDKHRVFSSKVVVSRLGVSDRYADDNYPASPARLLGAPLRIVSCANATVIKRLHLIARAISKTSDRVEWTHVGGGPELESLKRIVAAEGTQNRVIFTGALSNERVLQLLREGGFDFLISVSRWEGIPVTIMEAMSCGIPVVATDVGGVSEIVDRTNGILLPPIIDAVDLAEVLDGCAELTAEQWERMSRSARTMWSTRYNAEKNYYHFYKTILHTPGA